MITVEVGYNGHFTDVMISGHAGHAEHGKDIVCSAVSSMAFMLKNQIEYQAQVRGGSKSGLFNLAIMTPTYVTDIIVEGFLETLAQISKQYPETITIEGLDE